MLKVFFAGVKPDENGDRSRTFDELQHYVKQHAAPVGDKFEDYQSTVKGLQNQRHLLSTNKL